MRTSANLPTRALLGAIAVAHACAPAARQDPRPGRVAGYDLTKPRIVELPAELHEISGLTALDPHTVACVQDERGVVFDVDLRTGAIARRIVFGPDADYEEITRAGDALWVLRSDGRLLRLEPRGARLAIGQQIALDVGHDEFEGLCHDHVDGVLLVAPKDAPERKRERDERRVFAIDPSTGERRAKPALDTSLERIGEEALALGIALPREAARGRDDAGRVPPLDLALRVSAIAVHPRTGEMFLLSSADAALLAFDRGGALRGAHVFGHHLLPQAEGITFLADGTMVIASEGADRRARLVVFGYDDRSAAREQTPGR